MKTPKQITDEESLIGKTIQRVASGDDKMFLFFNDNTFVVFRHGGYEISYVEIMDDTYNIEPTKYNLYELREIGILSEEEYQILCEENRKNEAIVKEQKERELFIQLKEKFAKEKDNEMKWISVNTEKPPLTISNQYFMESEWVLVMSNGVPMVSRFQKGQVRESRKWEQWFDPFGGYELRGVTHWTPIEIPAKEKDNEI